MFNRIYHETNDNTFKDAAIYWYNKTIEKAEHADGLARFKTWKYKDGWVNQSKFLDGISGIGLCLISAINEVDPKWDKCLLIS